MNDTDLRRIADSLDDCIDGKPQSRLSRGVPWYWVTLNRNGCIVLAAKLLRLATAPIPEDGSEPTIPLDDIEQFKEHKSDLRIFRICKVECFDEDESGVETAPTGLKDRLAFLGCSVFALGALVFFASGVWYWISLIFFGR